MNPASDCRQAEELRQRAQEQIRRMLFDLSLQARLRETRFQLQEKIAQAIHEAEVENIDAMNEAIERELRAAAIQAEEAREHDLAQALIEEAKNAETWRILIAEEVAAQEARRLQDERIAREEAAKCAHEAAEATALAVYLNGLVSQAAANGDDVTISVPSNVQVAGCGANATAIDSLVAAVRDADEDSFTEAQQNAAQDLAKGLAPKPADLKRLLDQNGNARDWSKAFGRIADQMGEPAGKGFLITLKAQSSALADQLDLIDAFGAENLLELILDPKKLEPPPFPVKGRDISHIESILDDFS